MASSGEQSIPLNHRLIAVYVTKLIKWERECRNILCSQIDIDYEPLQDALKKYIGDTNNIKIIIFGVLSHLLNQVIPMTSFKFPHSEWIFSI